jgi:electron transport complex protein RnfB
MSFITGIAFLSLLTFFLATVLIIAFKKLRTDEDPRIDQIEELLPSANCGACGQAGCRAFAEALVSGKVNPGECTVSTVQAKQQIADLLGVEVGQVEKRVARLACAGGKNVSRNNARYFGVTTCQAAAQVSGGGKSCVWGCLGFGDCAQVCTFDAIHLNKHDLPIVDENQCTACGDCVTVCPKDLFSIEPVSHQLWVTCKNQEFGDDILKYCKVGCTACGRCALDAPNHMIAMQNNLPVIDYSKGLQTRVPIERCPTGAIVWFETDGTMIKGKDSVKIIRQKPLKTMPS